MSRPFLFTFTLLLSLAVAAQTTPSSTPHSSNSSSTPQATTPGEGSSAAPSAPGEPSAQDQARATIDKVGANLNLTADQKSKLQPILTQEIQLVHDLRADTSMSPEQKQAKFRETLTADHARIDAILTPEQKQKLTEMNRQHEAQESGQSAQPPAGATPAPGHNPSAMPGKTPGQAPNSNQPPTPPKP
jgi:periplasmic protein CpxP/Spy